MKCSLSLLLFFICFFVTLVHGYPLNLAPMGLAMEDHVQTLLGSPAPLLAAFSEGMESFLPHITNHHSSRDLATSLATTLLGGGLALYFT